MLKEKIIKNKTARRILIVSFILVSFILLFGFILYHYDLILTLFYLGLGINGYWNYSQQDFINGNLLVCFGVGICYLSKSIYKKCQSNKI